MNKEIVAELKRYASAEQREVLIRFFKTGKGQYGEGDRFLGVKVPQTRSVVKKYWQTCDLRDVDLLISSKYHEVRLAALLILVKKYKWAEKNDLQLADGLVKYYLGHTKGINNWDLVDLSCYEIVGRWVFRDLSRVAVLERLARSANMWEQRIAIVSTMQLIRNGELEITLQIADMLLSHEHDLIHKAVGWLLREVGKRDRSRLEAYLRPRYLKMPRTMLRYAIEKFPEELRKYYLLGTVPTLDGVGKCKGRITGDSPRKM